MSEGEAPIDVPRIPAERRFWLLSEALRSVPLDEALELARRAERFITGRGEECDRLPSRPLDGGSQQPGTESGYPLRTRLERTPVQAGARLALSAAQRNRLLDRLSQGARNGELASEFGLSSKQVQGIRMGSAREIAKRRDGCTGTITSETQETAWKVWLPGVHSNCGGGYQQHDLSDSTFLWMCAKLEEFQLLDLDLQVIDTATARFCAEPPATGILHPSLGGNSLFIRELTGKARFFGAAAQKFPQSSPGHRRRIPWTANREFFAVDQGKNSVHQGTVKRRPELTPWRHEELTP